METTKTDLRKKIRVRKNTSPEPKRNYDDEYHIPIAAQDSKWSGIAFNSQLLKTNPGCDSSEDECEIKIIDLESPNGTPPLLILFPELRNEESQEHLPAMSENMSTSSLTKLLRGKKPKMDLLKACKKLNIRPLGKLTPVKEVSHAEFLDHDSQSQIEIGTTRENYIKFKDHYYIDLHETHSLPKQIKE